MKTSESEALTPLPATVPRRRSRRTLWRIVKWTLTLAIGFWLVGCRAAGLISPLENRLLAFLPFTTAFATLANVGLFLILFLRRRLLRSTIPLLALIAAYPAVKPVFGDLLSRPTQSLDTRPQLKVLLWNVHGLGIYDRPVDKRTPGRMLDFIREQNPDIALLVEFYTDWEDAMKPHSASFLAEGGFRDFRFVWDNTLGSKIYIGIALFSKLPVSAVEERWIAKNINLMQSDIRVNEAMKVRILTLHLESFHLADQDKNNLDSIKKAPPGLRESYRLTRGTMARFVGPLQRRARQADTVAAIIRESPYPVIVCGDFNDLPGSYAYTTIRGSLNDAFEDYGKPFGRTYNRLSPTLRIDNIFYDPETFRCINFQRVKTTLSDHNPIIATFEIQKETANAE